MSVRFVLYYCGAQLRRKRKIIITMRCWRILKNSGVNEHPPPLHSPTPRQGRVYRGNEGDNSKQIAFPVGWGIGKFFLCFVYQSAGRGLRFAWGFSGEPAVSLH